MMLNTHTPIIARIVPAKMPAMISNGSRFIGSPDPGNPKVAEQCVDVPILACRGSALGRIPAGGLPNRPLYRVCGGGNTVIRKGTRLLLMIDRTCAALRAESLLMMFLPVSVSTPLT